MKLASPSTVERFGWMSSCQPASMTVEATAKATTKAANTLAAILSVVSFCFFFSFRVSLSPSAV